jgi:hypothetical protein
MANQYYGSFNTVTIPLSVTKVNAVGATSLPFSLRDGLSGIAQIDLSNTKLAASYPGIRAFLVLNLDQAAGGATLSADPVGYTTQLVLSAQTGVGGTAITDLLGRGVVYPVNITSSSFTNNTVATITIDMKTVSTTGLWWNTTIPLSAAWSANATSGNFVSTGGQIDNLFYLVQGVGIVNPRNGLRSVGSHARRQQHLG